MLRTCGQRHLKLVVQVLHNHVVNRELHAKAVAIGEEHDPGAVVADCALEGCEEGALAGGQLTRALQVAVVAGRGVLHIQGMGNSNLCRSTD